MNLQKHLAMLAVAETESMTRAAEQLGYTQSAVSRMIASLEEEWGVPLFRRSHGGIRLTAEGEQLLPAVRALVAKSTDLDYAVRELHGIQRGLVRVGTFTTAEDCYVPSLLTSFGKRFPKISFQLLHSESYEEIEEKIRTGQVDCGFVRIPAAPDLEVRLLHRDRLEAVLPCDHPLADAAIFPLSRLREEAVIKLKSDREISRFLEGVPVQYEVSSDHTILSMVESGVGVSVMHSLMKSHCRYKVVWKPLEKTEHRDVGLATAKDAKLSGAAALFVEHALFHFR